jgi:hypothetical protein
MESTILTNPECHVGFVRVVDFSSVDEIRGLRLL